MRYLFAILMLLAPALSRAQAPDEGAIVAAIVDPASPRYYPVLMGRYTAGDTTLTLDDYHYLYYGFAYQDEYRPLEPIAAETQLLAAMEAAGAEPALERVNEIIWLAHKVMAADPFSPRNINFLTWAHGLKGSTADERVNADRFDKIVRTIRGSGTGMAEDSPWHVLFPSHIADVLGLLGVDAQRRIVVSRSVEYVSLMRPVETESGARVRGYYFDYGRAYRKKPDDLPARRVRGMRFERF